MRAVPAYPTYLSVHTVQMTLTFSAAVSVVFLVAEERITIIVRVAVSVALEVTDPADQIS